MKPKLIGLVAVLVIFMCSSITAWANMGMYVISSPIVFSAPGTFGSVNGSFTTDGTLGPLSTQDITSWRIVVFDGNSSSGIGSDGVGDFVKISGDALVATNTGLFFNFADPTPSYVLFEGPAGTVTNRAFFCLNAGGANCGGLTPGDIAIQAVAPNLQGGSQSDIHNGGGILKNGVLELAVGGVPGPTIGAGLPGLVFAGGAFLAWWFNKRRAQALA
jgi:hypothetical protein